MPHHGAAPSLPQVDDTAPRAQQRYLERLRATPPRARLERALRLSEQVRNATFADVARKNPGASEAELALEFIKRVYGDEIAQRFAAHRHRR